MILTEPLFYIYLVYGLSFLFMAYIVLHGIRNATAISLVSTFYVLVLFGLAHGTAEIVDWARFILNRSGSGEIAALLYLSQILAGLSFIVLLQFGVNLLTYRSSRKQLIRLIPAILVAGYLVALFLMKTDNLAQASLLARRAFGVSGALLTGIALLVLARTMQALGNAKIVTGLVATSFGFAGYAIFGGVIFSPIAGLPIQLFRSVCAIVIAISSVSILDVFRAPDREIAAAPGLVPEVRVQF